MSKHTYSKEVMDVKSAVYGNKYLIYHNRCPQVQSIGPWVYTCTVRMCT